MKKCFVIQPFDGGKFDKRYKDVFKPAIKNAGLVPYRVDEDPSSSMPIDEIEKGIRESEICLADISLDNPNVWFELGYAISAGKPVIMTCSSSRTNKLPFDIQHRTVIMYKTESLSDFDDLQKAITNKAKALLELPKLTKEGSALLDYNTSRKGHFELARKLLEKKCSRVFLMQRSSSLILGAEHGWMEEKKFCEALVETINSGVEFLHIVSMDGILSHLAKKDSHFPEISDSLGRLVDVNGRISIASNDNHWYIKKIPESGSDPLLKPDRQARALIAEFEDGTVEGLLVSDLGPRQGWFSIKGPKVKKFMDACYEYYHECESFMASDVEKIKEQALLS